MRVPHAPVSTLGPFSIPLAPRLLDVAGAAAYLSLKPGTIRALVHGGVLRRVRIPLPDHGELRRVLLDRSDLDRLVEVSKEAGALPDATRDGHEAASKTGGGR